MAAAGERSVIYLVVVLKIDRIKCRTLIDMGAGSSYISEVLANLIGKQPVHKEIEAIHLHAFEDTSESGTATVMYAVVVQKSGTNQGLVAAKARLARKNLTITHLKLVSAHMAANLAQMF